MKTKALGALCALVLGACAGRDPEPIATVQPWDAQASCTQIRAEIEANNVKVKALEYQLIDLMSEPDIDDPTKQSIWSLVQYLMTRKAKKSASSAE